MNAPFREIGANGESRWQMQRLFEAAIIALVTATTTTWANQRVMEVKMEAATLRIERLEVTVERLRNTVDRLSGALVQLQYERRRRHDGGDRPLGR